MSMNEALRRYIKRKCELHQIHRFCLGHEINRNSTTRFANGVHDSVTLAPFESVIKEMIRAGEFDVNKWIKEGECDE